MSAQFDVVSKDLTELNPADLLSFLGQPRQPEKVRTIDADLSTITTIADKVIWVDDPQPWILHAEFHTYWDGGLPLSVHVRNALLRQRHAVPVATVIFLLRSIANAKSLTGVLRNETPIGNESVFNYEVIRLWTVSKETLLNGPLSMLPYAPLCGVKNHELPSVVARIKERIESEAKPDLAEKIWTATFILMGLEFKEEIIQELLAGVQGMRESATYQAILREGAANEARRIVVRIGNKRLGPADSATLEKLNSVNEVSQLEEMAVRVSEVSSWDELLIN